jgi:hypothetical protein
MPAERVVLGRVPRNPSRAFSDCLALLIVYDVCVLLHGDHWAAVP